ncbi:MAG: DUF445 domain-containing protein [Spirochaetaceae bacterium]
MTDTLPEVLSVALPPLLGAVIGYVTNYLAIRMLFRPLSAKRVFGVRLPLTPGIIPKQRYQLAESIGTMVSTQLLNEQAVRMHIRNPEFHNAVEDGVRQATDRLLSSVPATYDWSTLSSIGTVLREAAGGMLRSFMASAAFRDGVLAVARNALFQIARYELRSVVPSPERLRAILEGLVARAAEGDLRDAIQRAAHAWLERQLAADTPMSRFISEELIAQIERIADEVYGPTFEHVLEYLNRPDIRARLEQDGKDILRRILDKLTFVQRFFVTAAQYDQRLEERMPAIIDDLVATLRRAGWDPENRRRVVEAVGDALRKIRAQGVAEAVAKSRLDLPARVHAIIDEIADVLRREGVQARIVEALMTVLRRYENRSVGELLESLFATDLETLAEGISDRVAELVRPEAQSKALVGEAGRILRQFMESFGSGSIREIIGLRDETKEEIDTAVARGLTSLVEHRLPELVESLDIRRLVVNRVNSLDVVEVERLLLIVIARHLKWINLFGALLGALIGGSQVALSYLM